MVALKDFVTPFDIYAQLKEAGIPLDLKDFIMSHGLDEKHEKVCGLFPHKFKDGDQFIIGRIRVLVNDTDKYNFVGDIVHLRNVQKNKVCTIDSVSNPKNTIQEALDYINAEYEHEITKMCMPLTDELNQLSNTLRTENNQEAEVRIIELVNKISLLKAMSKEEKKALQERYLPDFPLPQPIKRDGGVDVFENVRSITAEEMGKLPQRRQIFFVSRICSCGHKEEEHSALEDHKCEHPGCRCINWLD